MKRKYLLLLCLLVLLLFQLIQFSRGYHDPNPRTSGSDFTIECGVGGSLGFQGRDSLFIEVLSGVWNSSTNSLLTYNDRGTLDFVALDNATLEISSDSSFGFTLEITGATQTRDLGAFTWEATVLTGDTVRIFWNWRIESWIDQYTMLTIGMSGLIMMVASPSWVAWQLRKGGIKPEDFERMMYGLLIFVVGFGLLVMWLWS